MRVLVTGGAGYIGSVTVELLLEAGHQVAVVDSLVEGHREAVDPQVSFHRIDIGSRRELEPVFAGFRPDAVIHLAAATLVSESMTDPGKYFLENVEKGRVFLETMVSHQVRRMVFSSSAAVYGEPEKTPITESDTLSPTNPYGESKLAFEKILKWYGAIHGVRSFSLRYFNAAGASEEHGEDHDPETHLIPRVLGVVQGRFPRMEVYGTDYDTRDGSCVRDYVHVMDLARAHLRALECLDDGEPSGPLNVGIGRGYTVLEVVQAVEEVTGEKVPFKSAPRRAGDPAVLVAASDKARRRLGWEPSHLDLESIVDSAWRWHQAHPGGYQQS